MSQDDPINVRLTKEITALSTNLVTAVAKQLELEEVILQYRKENQQLKASATANEEYKAKYQNLSPKYEEINRKYQENTVLKDEAESRVSKLEAEVEELTASLFDEANTMVSNASRETYNFKVKNGKLQEEIQEKNTIIENLQDQLKALKQLFFDMEIQQKLKDGNSGVVSPELPKKTSPGSSSPVSTHKNPISSENEYYLKQLDEVIFSPRIKSIRFDREEFNDEFKLFIFHITRPQYTVELSTLRNLKYFKRIWTEEIETTFPVIPTHNNLFNRWQKNKLFWNFIVEGKAVVEPISGINETFKLTYQKLKAGNSTEHPIATKEPCSFCGELKNDILEHSRLYSLRMINPDYDPKASTNDLERPVSNGGINVTEEFLASYPLCNFCLLKLRNIGDLFALLRSINTNVFKLSQNWAETADFNNVSTAGQSPTLTQAKRFNRLFNEEKSTSSWKVDKEDEAKLMKLYELLVKIRVKIFWSKIGYWDNGSNIEEVNFDDISHSAFYSMVTEESEVGGKVEKGEKGEKGESGDNLVSNGVLVNEKTSSEERLGVARATTNTISGSVDTKSESDPEAPSTESIANVGTKFDAESELKPETKPRANSAASETILIEKKSPQKIKNAESKNKNKKKKKKAVKDEKPESSNIGNPILVESSDDEFADAATEHPSLNDQPKRRTLTKEFKRKMSSDLDLTLSMLAESLGTDNEKTT